jgi:hypothetical protein
VASFQVNPYKDGTPGVTGYRSEVLSEVIVQEDKFTRLAEAIPAENIPSVHLPMCARSPRCSRASAPATTTSTRWWALKFLEGLDTKGIEKSTTEKTKVLAILGDSFEHARRSIAAIPDADLEKSIPWFGAKNTERGLLLLIVRHGAEHLGQSIAYARFTGVVPPWTEDAQTKQVEKKTRANEVPLLARIDYSPAGCNVAVPSPREEGTEG